MPIVPIGLDDISSAGLSLRLGSLANKDSEDLIRRCAGVGILLLELAEALAVQKSEEQGRLFDITDRTAEERELLDQALGAGEVSGVVALPDGVTAQIAESTMAGLWRVRFSDADDRLVGDYLEVGDVPEIVKRAAIVNARDVSFGEAPEGAMNVMPLLAEIRARVAAFTPGAKSHIVNFMLFPMAPEALTAGRVGFVVGRLEGFGRVDSCSLFSPMGDFADHAAARAVAVAALDQLFDPALADARRGGAETRVAGSAFAYFRREARRNACRAMSDGP